MKAVFYTSTPEITAIIVGTIIGVGPLIAASMIATMMEAIKFLQQ